jgi:hypothetical protein
LLRGLEDDGVPERERRGRLPERDGQRKFHGVMSATTPRLAKRELEERRRPAEELSPTARTASPA